MKTRLKEALTAEHLSADALTVVLLAVIAGHRYTSLIAKATRLSPNSAHRALHELRRLGLVCFTDNLRGTIHPNVEVIQIQEHQ